MSTTKTKELERRDVVANLVGLVLIVALFAVGLAYGIDALNRANRHDALPADSGTLVSANIAGVPLEVPSSSLRFPETHDDAFVDRLDLKVVLDVAGGRQIGITLVPKARARASASLLDSVYLQHFTSEELRGAPGLVGKPLSKANGYDGETVWYDPISANPFAAKCAEPLDSEADARCVRTLTLDSGLSAILDFDFSALNDWRAFDPFLADFFVGIGAGQILR